LEKFVQIVRDAAALACLQRASPEGIFSNATTLLGLTTGAETDIRFPKGYNIIVALLLHVFDTLSCRLAALAIRRAAAGRILGARPNEPGSRQFWPPALFLDAIRHPERSASAI
jgi:hypothetical protein